MIYIAPGLYVIVEQLETPLAPVPKPLSHGFSEDTAYLVLGGFSLAESGEAYFILSNDRDEIWFISNRHLRTSQLLPDSRAFRLPRSRHSESTQQSLNGRAHSSTVLASNP